MHENNSETRVLVTGGSGFLGIHCLIQLMEKGYKVSTTIRDSGKKEEVLHMLRYAGIENLKNLSFFQADLFSENGWQEAIAGSDYILHVASPFPAQMPVNENDLIIPAREGSLRILKIAYEEGVKRVILTSSFAAVGYGQLTFNRTFTEDNWTDPDNKNITAYVKSKTLAEKAAWEFMQAHSGKTELTVINPVGIFGPILGKKLSSSIYLLKQLLDGSIRSSPRTFFNIVDVRDVADLHIRAMVQPRAAGQRYLALAGNSLSIHEMAQILKSNLGENGKYLPRKELPDWQVRIAALFDTRARQLLPQLGVIRKASNHKAMTELGWQPRSNEEALLASARSLLEFGLIPGI